MHTGRLMGIDHGLKRIGLSVSDFSWLVARELTVIKRASKAEDFAKIARIISEQKVAALVIGLPSNEDTPEGEYSQADKVRTWAQNLQQAISLPVIFWDEQLTSVDATELARQMRRKPYEPIDDLAARLILQSYLDALRDGLAVDPFTAPSTDTPPTDAGEKS